MYTPADYRGLSSALAGNSQLTQTLRSLTLEYQSYFSPILRGKTGPPVALFVDVLEPLIHGTTSGLETLIVKYDHEAAIFSDDEVRLLVQASPLLKHLTLSLGAEARELTIPTQVPTVAALHHIGQYCHFLKFLEIEIQDSDYTETFSPSMTDHPLETLRLAVRTFTSRACDSSEIQRQVRRIFPTHIGQGVVLLSSTMNEHSDCVTFS